MTDRPLLFTLEDLLTATDGVIIHASRKGTAISSVGIDSRTVRAGGLFVALKGERTDGHEHVGQAAERGASALLVSREKARGMARILEELASSSGPAVICVPDTLEGLQSLARFHMRRLPPVTCVGITGSNGKTTTKEIIGSILTRESATAVNEGNLNSEIGLPLACFAVAPSHRYAVFEMGINRVGEMDVLEDIVRPDVALITNIGSAHIGLLGSREGIAKEKKKIFTHFSGKQMGFLREGEEFSRLLAEGVNGKVGFFGPKSTRGFRGSESLGLDGTLIHWEGFRIRFPLFGPFNLSNALGAISVTMELGVPPAVIRDGLEAVKPLFGRSQLMRGPVTVVFDCYNANPDSMERALSFIAELEWPGRKLAVLGGMRELGAESAEAHRALGRRLAGTALDGVLLFGEEMADAYREMAGSPLAARSAWTVDFRTLAAKAREILREGDLLLIKGSRGMELERLLPEVKAAGRGGVPCC